MGHVCDQPLVDWYRLNHSSVSSTGLQDETESGHLKNKVWRYNAARELYFFGGNFSIKLNIQRME
jgi:hypothetical protein